MKSSNTQEARWRSELSILVICISSLAVSACAGIGAAPWDRDLLAQRAMQLNTHPHLTAFNDHIYFSKEASAGGRTFDGGGCGCN